jgi:hypothetical protein
MAEPETELEYKQRFILRVTESRTASGMKQWQIAEAMGIPQDKYKQYGRLILSKKIAILLPSHQSAEQGHRLVLQALNVQPLVNLDLRLGDRKTRYALVVTLKTRNVDLDIYTPIETVVRPIPIETTV